MGPHARQITSEVYQVGGSGFTASDDAAAYLICADGAAALIDCGCGDATDLLLANVESTGTDPQDIGLLLLTHCHFDHVGGAAELRRRLPCRVVAHALDTAAIESGDPTVTAASWYGRALTPCPVDVRLDGTISSLAIGPRRIDALHIPDHSPGSLAFRFESAGRTLLFAQDVHGPLHPDLRSDARAYQASLQRLLAVGADVLCEGHYGIFEGRERVADFIERFVH